MSRKAKGKAKSHLDEEEVDDDENEWVEEKEPEPKEPAAPEQYAEMPENKPGKAPPDPRDQAPVPPDYDLAITPQPEKKED